MPCVRRPVMGLGLLTLLTVLGGCGDARLVSVDLATVPGVTIRDGRIHLSCDAAATTSRVVCQLPFQAESLVIGDPGYLHDRPWPSVRLDPGLYEVTEHRRPDNNVVGVVISRSRLSGPRQWSHERSGRWNRTERGLFYYGLDRREVLVMPQSRYWKLEQEWSENYDEAMHRQLYRQLTVNSGISDAYRSGVGLGVAVVLTGADEHGRTDVVLILEASAFGL